METCIWCDMTFQSRIELEAHVEDEHAFMKTNVRMKV